MWIAAISVVVVAIAGAGYAVASRQPFTGATSQDDRLTVPCADPEIVTIAPAPEIQEAVRFFVSDLAERTDSDCIRTQVVSAEPAEVSRTAAVGTTIPDIWIPDSSLWVAQAQAAGAQVEVAGSFGSTPVVVAANGASPDAAGWTASPPSWPALLSSGHGLAVPDVRNHAPSLLALSLARAATAGDPAVARRLTAAVVLAQQRATVTSTEAGLVATVESTTPIGPVVVSGAAALRRATETVNRPGLIEVTPIGGSAILDYPVVVGVEDRTPAATALVDEITAGLLSAAGLDAAATAGLEAAATDPAALTTIPAADLGALTAELDVLAKPSQILVVVDVSTSMLAEVSPGVTRADVASQALANALVLLPDSSRVGFWVFASRLEGEQDYSIALPITQLDAAVGETDARAALGAGVAGLPGRLVPGGTSLYDVTLAAMDAAEAEWDPDVVTSVALITDGENEDSTGLTLEALTAELQSGGDPARPVGLVAVAFGPDADLATLQAIAASAGARGPSQAVDATDPSALAGVLLAALSARG